MRGIVVFPGSPPPPPEIFEFRPLPPQHECRACLDLDDNPPSCLVCGAQYQVLRTGNAFVVGAGLGYKPELEGAARDDWLAAGDPQVGLRRSLANGAFCLGSAAFGLASLLLYFVGQVACFNVVRPRTIGGALLTYLLWAGFGVLLMAWFWESKRLAVWRLKRREWVFVRELVQRGFTPELIAAALNLKGSRCAGRYWKAKTAQRIRSCF